MDPRFRHPLSCIVSAPSNNGKTHFVIDVINASFFDVQFDDIIWCYTEKQPAYDLITKKVRFVEGLVDGDTLDPKLKHLVVLDDMMSLKDNRIEQFFVKTCHHRNTSCFFLVQNLFSQGPGYRNCSLNASYIVLFPSARDRRQIVTLESQMFPGQKNYLLDSYNDACAKPYSHLVIDLKADTPNHLRLRARIFDENPVFYLPQSYKYTPDSNIQSFE